MRTSLVRRYALILGAMSAAAALFVKGGVALDGAYIVVLATAFITTFRGART